MEKRNQDYCKADAIAGLAALVNRDSGHVNDDYGLLESLASDTLSPNEARRFAEHLKTCEDCRKACAAMGTAGIYDDAPFGERMRAFEKDPASEKDENWKTIAVAFNEELAALATKADVSVVESVSNDLYVAPAFERVLADWEARKPKARPQTEPRRSLVKWSALAHSAAGLLVGLVAAQFLGGNPDVGSEDLQIDGVRGIGAQTQRTKDVAQTKGTKDVALTQNQTSTNDNDPLDSAYETPANFEAWRDMFSVEVENIQARGVTFKLQTPIRFSVEVENIQARGYQAFNEGNFQEATNKFGVLVELGKLLQQENADANVSETLGDMYWNLGVAAAKNGEKEKAVEVFTELNNMDLSPKKRKRVEAALAACKKESKPLSK